MDIITGLTALLLTLLAAGVFAQPITCEAGHFKEGQDASVTCDFHRSLEDIPHHIYVIQHPLNAPNHDSGKDILGCFHSIDQKLVCKEMAAGVRFVGIAGGRLTFIIPAVTTDFAGNYLCQLVPPDDTTIAMCSLTVKGTPVTSFNETHSQAQSETRNLPIIFATASGVCILVITFVTCIIFVLRRRMKRRPRHRNPTYRSGVQCEDVDEMSSFQALEHRHNIKRRDQWHNMYSTDALTLPETVICSPSEFNPILKEKSSARTNRGDTPIDSGVGSENESVITNTIETAQTSMLCKADGGSFDRNNGSCLLKRPPSFQDFNAMDSLTDSNSYYSTSSHQLW